MKKVQGNLFLVIIYFKLNLIILIFLGEELTSFAYWNLIFKNNGFVNIKDFCVFLRMFKFSVDSILDLKKEFNYAL